VTLTTHLHLVLTLRMSGAIPLLALHSSVVCTGKTVPLPFALCKRTNLMINHVNILLCLLHSTSLCIMLNCVNYCSHMGHVVAQLVEAMRYKSEGHVFNSRWFHWNFSLT
jgi:hypothetical protein